MRTRFAPSPTGPLHLGHAFSALTAWDLARAAGGVFLLRIEDLDQGRSRPVFEAGITEDLAWLGLEWPRPVLRQSEHRPRYAAALDRLTALGVTYACRCARADIRAALSAPQDGAPVSGEVIYPGTCRGRPAAMAAPGEAIRLNVVRALALAPGRLEFVEDGPAHRGRHRVEAADLAGLGDVVLGRRDGAAAYHLAVVVDDAHQGINHVVRGEDLWPATPLHRLLQALLDLPSPVWHHHRLIRDAAGKRLAKRDDARALARYRAEGVAPADIRRLVGL
ncbi:MAG: tRNA glutamyl-Q(34) synthetase GluQRS [Amaricoccus sp.]|uniref:tRNA glutamyl-Q(34) synthetase GluQRS n=1 Tax=Amaricoccus sp. TaxID=1872485 RepID=UPI003315D499